MSGGAQINAKSISAQMAAGNNSKLQRMRALLKDHAPKTNHHFCPPLRTTADNDKSWSIAKAAI